VRKLISTAIEEGYKLVRPQALYDEMAAGIDEQGRVVLDNGAVLDNPHAVREWQGLEQAGVAICTIGLLLEQRVGELFAQGNAALALLLDSVGTTAVGSVSRQMDALICRRAENVGMNAGPRFSPGSTGWDITQQKIIFSLLPANEVGVSLNEHFMMIPIKSVSFVVGMGSKVPVPKVRRPCGYCPRVDCPGREQGTSPAIH
jgi:hypothetical protein